MAYKCPKLLNYCSIIIHVIVYEFCTFGHILSFFLHNFHCIILREFKNMWPKWVDICPLTYKSLTVTFSKLLTPYWCNVSQRSFDFIAWFLKLVFTKVSWYTYECVLCIFKHLYIGKLFTIHGKFSFFISTLIF